MKGQIKHFAVVLIGILLLALIASAGMALGTLLFKVTQ